MKRLLLPVLVLLAAASCAHAQPATTTVPGQLFTYPLTLPGSVTEQKTFARSGAISSPAWTTSGIGYANVGSTLTDTTSSGTVPTMYSNLFGGDTIAASSATTYTNHYGTYFKADIAGSNATLTHNYALGADSINTSSLAIGGTAQTFPASGLLVGTTDTQTLSGKTLTSPTINSGTLSGTFSGSPTFSGTVTLSTALAVGSGGIGTNTLTAHGVLFGEGTSAINPLVGLTTGQCLIAQGASADPIFGGCGNLPTNAQSGAYSIAANDCGKLVTESGSQSIVTLPAASGFGDGCIITLTNVSTTRAQTLSGWPDSRALGSTYSGGTNFCGGSCLWPGQTIQVQSNHSTWQILALNPIRYYNTINPALYVWCSASVNGGSCAIASSCSDANDGLTVNSPVCTIQQAENILVSQFDRGAVNPWIELVSGAPTGINSYTGGVLIAGQSAHRSDGITIIASPSATYTASVTGSVMTVTAVAAGSIHVNDYLFTPGTGPIGSGYYIISNGTGSGGTGTYNIGYDGSVASPGNFTSTTVNSYVLGDTRIVAPANSFALAAFDKGIAFPTNLAIQCSASASIGLYAYQFATMEINNVEMADCTGNIMIEASNTGHVDIDNGLLIAGNANWNFWADGPGAQIDTYGNAGVTCSAGGLAFNIFAKATNHGQIQMTQAAGMFNGCTAGGGGTKQNYNGDGLSLFSTGGSTSTSYFPGSGGALTNGAVYE